MQLKALILGVCAMVFAQTCAINLPYEVEETLVHLLSKKTLKHLNTSSRSVVPIYRKDLDPTYIAYYQIEVSRKHFYVLSAGPKTGDHELAQSGPTPSPTKVLTDQAQRSGQVCSKFYMLSSLGLYMCENAKGRAVAATYDWVIDSPVSNWKKLQKMVVNSLNDFKKEWKKVALLSKEEWKTSQRKPANKNPTIAGYNAEILSPGSTGKVALEKDHGKITIHAIPSSRQGQLCKILVKVCTGQNTAIKQGLTHKAKNGISFVEFRVKGDGGFVRKVLGHKDISFYFKVGTKTGEQVLKYFSVDLSRRRPRRWSSWQGQWSVKHERLFPEYSQHRCCGCNSGCGPVAWAQVLAFYDRLAHTYHTPGFSRRFWSCSDGWGRGFQCKAPARMNNNVKKYIEGIRRKLGTFCLFGGGATTPKGMKRIIQWYRARGIGGRVHSYIGPFSWMGWASDRYVAYASRKIQSGYPAIVGIWVKGSKKKAMHYAVATRYTYRKKRYRSCFLWWCKTKTKYERRLYLHMGWGGASNGWYRVPAAFAAYAATKY